MRTIGASSSRFAPVGTLRPGGRRRRSRSSTPCSCGELGELRVVVEELVQAVLEVEPGRDALPAAARATPAGSGRPAWRRRRARSSARTRAPPRPRHDRDPSSRLARALRVEDRDDRVGAVAHDAARGLPVVRVAASGPQRGSGTSSDTEAGLVGRELDAVAELDARPRVVREQQVAVEVDVVAEAGDRARRPRSRARTRPCSRA